jgi:hypothetical protein
LEDPTRTENCTIGFRIENVLPIEIQDSKQITEILNLVNTGQISNPEYPVINFSIVKSVVNVIDGKSMDDNRTCLFASISTFCLFVEMVSNEKEHENNINEPMSHFSSNAFLESNEKERGKGISELMSHFSSMFLKFDKNV